MTVTPTDRGLRHRRKPDPLRPDVPDAEATTTTAIEPPTVPLTRARPTSIPPRTTPITAPRRSVWEVTTTTVRAGAGRISGIDGLRGVAVALVVAYHYFGTQVPGGYLGVDVFFVLSGYLITSLLLSEKTTTGTVSLIEFWRRRARRILPAALTVTLVTCAFALFAPSDTSVRLGSQVLGVLTFSSNWVQIAQSQSYFVQSEVQFFAHYWSLAVEEQFYLLWPLLFAVVMAARSRRLTLPVTLGLAAVSAIAMAVIFSPTVDPTRVYYGTDTHAFGLLIGAALAFWLTRSSNGALPDHISYRTATNTSVIGLGVLATCALLMSSTSSFTYRGGLVLVSLATGAVLLAVIARVGPADWLFRRRVLRYLGTRSFSIYLWHWPVWVLLKSVAREQGWIGAETFPLAVGIAALAVTLVLSEASYRWVETPVRRNGFRGTLRAIFRRGDRTVIAATVVTLTVATLAAFAVATAPSASSTARELQRQEELLKAQKPPTQVPSTPPPRRAMPTGRQITVIGDSVALASAQNITATFPGIYIDAQVSRQWTAAEPIVQSLQAQRALAPYVVVALGTNGNPYPGLMDRILDAIGKDRKIILVTSFADRVWTPDTNRQIWAAQKSRPNVTVADWQRAITGHQQWLQSDAVHPIPGPGTALYAQTLRDAIARAAGVRR